MNRGRCSDDAPASRRLLASVVRLTLLLCAPLLAWSEVHDTFEFQRLADDLGGRQSSIYDIFEDSSGLLWVAGDTDGLLRFDGNEFVSWSEGFVADQTRTNVSTQIVTPNGHLWVGSWGNGLQYWDPAAGHFVVFLADPDDPDALADNRVQRMHVDSTGRVWIGTAAGINLIDPDRPRQLIRFARDEPDHPLYAERIWGIVEQDDGFWFATTGGIYWLSADWSDWRHYLLDQEAAEVFERGAEVRTIAEAHGELWAGSQLGLFRFDAEADRFAPVGFARDADHPTPRINVISESHQGHVWVGAFDGLYAVDPQRHEFKLQHDSFNRIADVDIRALYEDTEGNLWIGSRDQGMIHGRRDQSMFMQLAAELPEEIRARARRLTSAVLFDEQGQLWLGVPGGILHRAQDGSWEHWTFPGEVGVRRVESMIQGPDGIVWIGTNDGLFRIGPDQQLVADSRVHDQLGIGTLAVHGMHVEPDGTLWLGLWQAGVARWHPEDDQVDLFMEELQVLRGDLAYQLIRDEAGQLWAATRYSGLFRFNGESFDPVALTIGDQAAPPTFYCVWPERPDLLWLCTEDGLVRYDLASGQHEVFGIEDGLPGERITGFVFDQFDNAWVLTSQGVGRRLAGDERFVSFGLTDGLPGLALQRNAVAPAPDGSLVLGTSHGAVTVDPAAPPRGLNAPRTVLSRLWVDGKERTRSLDLITPSLELPPDFRDLMVQFAVLDFHEPDRNMARIQLRGYDAEFGQLTRDQTVRYMNLPPGHYTLEIEGWSSRGVRGEESLLLPIRVLAPWWHSPIAWAFGGVALIGLIWLTVWVRNRHLQKVNRRLQVRVEEKTRELEQANERLRARSARDFLTGLFNRRGFTERFMLLQKLSVRSQTCLSLILFDLDHFKRINDNHGHDAGDEVLRLVGQALNSILRDQDLAGRWGGEEFVLALPDTDSEGALEVCEKIRARLGDANLPVGQAGALVSIRATMGVVTGKGSEQPLEVWIKAADEALYAGKNSGRDCIQMAPSDAL